MNLSIPKDKKIETLKELISDCEAQVYRYALACGVDPDELAPSWTPPDYAVSADLPMNDLARELARLNMLTDKLKALG